MSRLDASLKFRAWEERGGVLQVEEGVAGGGALNMSNISRRGAWPFGRSLELQVSRPAR